MSNNFNRYRALYNKMPRPNSVTPFSKHVFMRSQNRTSTKTERLGNRTSCFESTYVHLKEEFSNREVHLIGTMNTSTMLAKRTQKLIREIQPDTVMVMSSPKWWDVARLIKDIESQEEFEKYQSLFLSQASEFEVDASYFRGAVFWSRMAILQAMIALAYRMGEHFTFYTPGLEIKYA